MRAKAGLSQSGLAAVTGLTQAQISRIESRASRRPAYEAISSIAKHFQVDPESLVEGSPLKPATRPLTLIPEGDNPGNHLAAGFPGPARREFMADLACRFERVLVIDGSGEWTPMLENVGINVKHTAAPDVIIPAVNPTFQADANRIRYEVGDLGEKDGTVTVPGDEGWSVIELLKDESPAGNQGLAADLTFDFLTRPGNVDGKTVLVLDEADWLMKSPSFLSLVRQRTGPATGLHLIAGVFRGVADPDRETLYALLETFPGRTAALPDKNPLDDHSDYLPERFKFDPERDRSFSGWEQPDPFDGWGIE